MAAYNPQAVPPGTSPNITAHATPNKEERKLAKAMNEEYHDPLDDWSNRDILISLVPYIVAFAFKDTSLVTAYNFGIAWSGAMLILRTVAWDSRRKTIWPMLDIMTLTTFAVLRGLMRHFLFEIRKWHPLLLPLIFVTFAILSLLIRRPFVGHYARYPKFDRGGKGVWHNDAAYRRTADLATLGWIAAWSITLLLALVPILTGGWDNWGATNIIFCYVVPFVCIAFALIFQQLMGAWYRSKASKATTTVANVHQEGIAPGTPGYPTNAHTPAYSPV